MATAMKFKGPGAVYNPALAAIEKHRPGIDAAKAKVEELRAQQTEPEKELSARLTEAENDLTARLTACDMAILDVMKGGTGGYLSKPKLIAQPLFTPEEVGSTVEKLREGCSAVSLKEGHVLLVLTPEKNNGAAYAVVSREEGGLPDSKLPKGVQRFRLQELVPPNLWKGESSPWSRAWVSKIANHSYAGLEVGDKGGDSWVMGRGFVMVEHKADGGEA